MFNAITNGGAKDEDCLGVHELLYLDIDDVPYEEVEGLKSHIMASLPFVEASWRSISGRGVGFIARTKGNHISLFSSLKKHIISLCASKNIHLDKGCISLTRKNYISYDPEVIRQVPSPIDVASLGLSEKSAESRIKKASLGYTGLRTFLRLTDHDTYFQGEFQDTPHRYFKDKVGIIKVQGAYQKVATNRNSHLFHNLMRLYYLNQHLKESALVKMAYSMNSNQLMDPLEENEVEHIARNIFKGQYTPEPNYWINLVYNPKFSKKVNANKLIAQENKEEKDRVIYQAIEAYDLPQKLTIKSLSAHSGISQDRLKRAWPTFKDYVRSLNEAMKGQLSPTAGGPKATKRKGTSGSPEKKKEKETFIQEKKAIYLCIDNNQPQHEEQDIC